MQAKRIDLGRYKIMYAETGPVATNTYIFIDTESNVSILFDAPPQSAPFINAVLEEEKSDLSHIYLTHSHWDHFGDALELKNKYNCEISVNKLDEYRLLEPNKYLGFPIPITFPVTKPDKYLPESGNINFGEIKIDLLHVPGHTEGSICFAFPEHKLVIAGDTLFRGSIGRTDLHGGDMETLLSSIRKNLFSLPDEYTVLSGHGPETTIGYEKKYNQFVGETPSTTIGV